MGNRLCPQGNNLCRRGSDLFPRGNDLGPRGNDLGPRGNDLLLRGNDLLSRDNDTCPSAGPCRVRSALAPYSVLTWHLREFEVSWQSHPSAIAARRALAALSH